MRWSVEAIAAAIGGQVEGDGARQLSGLLGLEDAGPEHLSFLSNPRYLRAFRSSRAGAILVGQREPALGHTVIRCADPYAAFSKALRLFHPEQRPAPGIHPQAVVEGEATGATVMAFAYVGPTAIIGEGSILQPFCYVGPGARVGKDCLLMAGSVVMDGCSLGDRCVLNPGAVVGGEGFGFAPTASGLLKIPQTGQVVVEDDVEIGANSCVDRAAMGETRVGTGSKLDNLVQVGHGAQVGAHNTLVSGSAVAGSTRTGTGVTLAAHSLVLGHLELGAGTMVGAGSMLTQSTPSGARRTGYPALEHDQWLQVAAQIHRLPELLERVRKLEEELARRKG
jgi:UDP-3-O-[3-hydroxymyristoyl] glucosamine N-acyltransferase